MENEPHKDCPRQIKVLVYHRIARTESLSKSHWTYTSEGALRVQMDLLERWGFTPITLNDYLLFTRGDIELPKKPVILTFDDGYTGVYEIAFPALKEHGMNAVIFVLGDRDMKTDRWDRRLGLKPESLVTPDQMNDMLENGFEIGSHSLTHTNLTNVSAPLAWEEISESKDRLELSLGTSVSSFCYPYGAVNDGIKGMVKQARYELACGVYTGPPRFGVDLYDIRRISITNTTTSISFAAKLLLPYEYAEWYASKVIHRMRHRMIESDGDKSDVQAHTVGTEQVDQEAEEYK